MEHRLEVYQNGVLIFSEPPSSNILSKDGFKMFVESCMYETSPYIIGDDFNFCIIDPFAGSLWFVIN